MTKPNLLYDCEFSVKQNNSAGTEAKLIARFSFDHCTALITGASVGLGAEFARQIAPQARCLILVARREPGLNLIRDELWKLNPQLNVILCPADVSTAEGRQAVVALIAASNVPINVLINNAGLGDYGPFESAAIARVQSQIDVNVTALVLLTHAILPVLRQHPPAGILNVSSLAGDLPLPNMAVYAATKAFVSSFSEALRIELLDSGIRVTTLCPGPTPTNFSQSAHRTGGSDTERSGQSLLLVPPPIVVARGLSALSRGLSTVYPGWGVRCSALAFRFLPRWILCWFLLRRQRATLRR